MKKRTKRRNCVFNQSEECTFAARPIRRVILSSIRKVPSDQSAFSNFDLYVAASGNQKPIVDFGVVWDMHILPFEVLYDTKCL